ncbi:MAG: RidA family protein [Candidimonas sp.]|nr:MAG: RidA family protein [Candidimonas sp.]
MNDIVRIDPGKRFCQAVVRGDTVHLAGIAANVPGGIEAQTREVLKKIDGYLKQCGTDKSRLLFVQIWLRDIARDYAGMNAVWSEWVPKDAMPARATCQAALAAPELLVEIIVTAAR